MDQINRNIIVLCKRKPHALPQMKKFAILIKIDSSVAIYCSLALLSFVYSLFADNSEDVVSLWESFIECVT